MTHLYWRRGFILFWGEARSEISASALQLGTVSAGGKAHHHRLIKDLYPFRHVFSHFLQTLSPAFCWELFKVREWPLSQLFCCSFHNPQQLMCGFLINVFSLTKVKYAVAEDVKGIYSFLILKQSKNHYVFKILLICSFGLSPVNASLDLSWTSFTLFSKKESLKASIQQISIWIGDDSAPSVNHVLYYAELFWQF